jgi:hypothetical protein
MYGSIASLDINGGAVCGDVSAVASPARWMFKGGIHWRDECAAGADLGSAATGSDCVSDIRKTDSEVPVVSSVGRLAEIKAGC